MKHNINTYLILLVVFSLSFGAAWAFPVEDAIKGIIAFPGIAALISTLWQLMKDQAAHEKSLEIQHNQFKFTLGAASHMANVAFNKHVEFCESYVTEIHSAVTTLFREGASKESLVHAQKLYQLRIDSSVWLTANINEKLAKFESALRQIGADEHFVQSTAGHSSYAEQRSRAIDRSHTMFLEILGIDKEKEVNEEYAVEAVITKVRAILGVEELTNLREHLVAEASKALNEGI